MDEQELARLIAAYKAVASTPTATYGHGRGGAFSARGLERPVFSAMVLPQFGLAAMLPKRKATTTDPLYGILTGVTAVTGTDPVGVCDDPKVAGLSKLCTHAFVWGRQSLQTPVYQVDRFGETINRAEFTDLQLIGTPQMSEGIAPSLGGATASEALNNERSKMLFEFVVSWYREFARETYTGNPTNNSAGGGRRYYHGLDTLINTGYRDAETTVACPAADSIVASFANQDVATAAAAIVRLATSVYRRLRYIASQTGLDPARWGIAMPWTMFYELTEVWPCAYMTYRCQPTGSGSTNQTDSKTLIEMRDGMRGDIYNRTGQYLLIDGERVPVIIDDAIAEDRLLDGASNPTGQFRSSMYFVPLTVVGGTPVTYMEYFDFDTPGGAIEAIKAFGADSYYRTSDSGRFLWHNKPPTNWCIQMLALAKPRLLLLTPQIAGRITNVLYTPLAHERSGFTDSPFYVNGGATTRTAPTYASPVA